MKRRFAAMMFRKLIWLFAFMSFATTSLVSAQPVEGDGAEEGSVEVEEAANPVDVEETAPELEPVAEPLVEDDAAPEGDAAVDGDAAPEGDAAVDGDAAAEGDAAVDGDAAAEGDAAVDGDAAAEGDAAVDGDAAAEGGLNAHTMPNTIETAEIIHTLLWSGRMVSVPDFMLDSWFSMHGSHWEGQSNFSFGAQYDLRFVDTLDLSFGIYYADMTMPAQYWLEDGENYASADYMKQNLSVLSFEVNVYGYYDFIPELGIFYGGGLWGGAFFGELVKANVDVECADAAELGDGLLEHCAHDRIFAEEEGIPPIIGFVNAAFGLRSVLADRFVLKLEAGFRGYFYGGFAMGAQFF